MVIVNVTLVCKHSHVFKNVCQGRLLLQKGNNSSLIQKQYIRGLPRHNDAAEHQMQKGWPFLAKHLLMTATICGCSFAGAIVWDHIQVARGVRRIPTLYVIRYKGFHISFAKMYGYILLANTVVFAMWRIPRLLPFMQRYFLSSSCKGAMCAIIGVVGCAFPDSRFSIAFLDQIYPHSFSAKSGILALLTFDTLGLVLRWKMFDHAAHLGGTLFGIFYITYGADMTKYNLFMGYFNLTLRELDLDNLISKLVLPKVRINDTGSLNTSTYSTVDVETTTKGIQDFAHQLACLIPHVLNSTKTDENASSTDFKDKISCLNPLSNSAKTELQCFMDHLKRRQPLESANCTSLQQPINKQTLGSYNCSNISDVIHAVNLYYELKDVFGGINISAIPSLTTPGVTTTPMATSVPPQSSLIDIETIKEQSNRTLNPNMTLEKVNELATQLEVVVNGSETDTKTVTQILSHMSEIEITNSQTVETFSRISTTVIHTYNETSTDTESSEIVMPDLLYSMENVLSSASPNENITIETSEMARVSTIIYKTINQKWSVRKGYHNAQIGSNVMSVSVQNLDQNKTHKAEVNVTGAITVVLPTNVTGMTKKHERVLYIMTTLGCSISIACLALTLIIYVYLRVLSNDTVMIHANLSVALLLGQLVLVTSDGAAKYMAACKIVTALIHFLFMSAFAWMMVEGLALYLSCTRPISAYGDMRMIYVLIGWGLPAIIVLITLGSNFQDYGEGEYSSCWLSIDDGLIWSFMAPMIIIVVMNILVLGLVLKAFLTLRTNSKKTEAARLFASFKVMVTLLPILGITWLLGILVPVSDVFHYLFIIGTSMQVRKKYNERRRRNTCSTSDFWPGSTSEWTDRRQQVIVKSAL
uniref:G-protein coupled receptors family 2 profile 2 domain-containing protein n=1 Tax=Magallana gigas TaxID=29159 RepID=K1QL08_MAGGI